MATTVSGSSSTTLYHRTSRVRAERVRKPPSMAERPLGPGSPAAPPVAIPECPSHSANAGSSRSSRLPSAQVAATRWTSSSRWWRHGPQGSIPRQVSCAARPKERSASWSASAWALPQSRA
ncbi:hypothetical protein ACFQ10_05440 [Streptomyces indonesiensis]